MMLRWKMIVFNNELKLPIWLLFGLPADPRGLQQVVVAVVERTIASLPRTSTHPLVFRQSRDMVLLD